MRRLIHFMLFSFIMTLTVSARQYTGSIKGQVVESDTQAPLPGANVLILDTTLGAASDNEGFFAIDDVPAGSYSLQFQFIGYQKVVKTDVIVKSNRVTTVNAELRFAVVEMQGITVTGGYFPETDAQAVSAINFSNEEIRRSAGSHGDVSRIIAMLPSVAPTTDQTNNLVVRGGNPGENAFYVDNVQIPNINHFPTEGSAGGALGILNVDFIDDVDFYAGGFSSAYGDRLSSVMDITFREGSRERLTGQVDLNWAGFGIVGEGPLARQKGAWLFSARKSYLDLVVRAIDVGNTIAPRYGDYQGKMVYDINQNHKISLLAVWSEDANRADKQTAIENDMIVFMNQDIQQNTMGVNWRALWSANGYSNTSFAYTMERYDEEAFDTGTEDLLMDNDSWRHLFALRNSSHFRLSPSSFIDFGLDGKLAIAQFHNFYGEQIDPAGKPLPPLRVENKSRANLIGGFFNYSLLPFEKMTIRLGCRVDHSSMNGNVQFAPRAEFSFRLSPVTTLQASAGLYYQQLPIELLSKNRDLLQLKSTRAAHFIFGVSRLLTENTKFTCELYRKDYDHFPLSAEQPQFFIIDEPFYNNGFYRQHQELFDIGKAYSEGIEMMVQKKLAKNIYGLASLSWFRSRYQDYDQTWRDRLFDQRMIASIEGGYKPSNKWEFSLHWIYSGGRPYTPFDVEKSIEANTGVLNSNLVNQARYPHFNYLNLRVDRRWHFSRTNLVLYLSVYNALNRQNVSAYYWNSAEERIDTIYQWGSLPIFGIEYEF